MIAAIQWSEKGLSSLVDQFVAYTNMCKFLAALKNAGEAPMPSRDLVVIKTNKDAGKIMAAAKERV
jgi:hypothetical protein